MKKVSKLLFTSLLLGGLVIPLSGCVKPTEPFVPPESSDKVLINDAYDWNEDETGSTRPELGGGYVPAPPAKEAVVTIAEGSAIKFKDGKQSLTLPVGELLTTAHFDEATLGGHSVGGVAVLDEDGKIAEVSALKDFVPTMAVTVMPFYSLDKGVDVRFGAKLVGDYVLDADFNDISEETTIATSTLVKDSWLWNKIDVDGVLAEDSSFRALTPFTVNEGYSYTYSYKFTNYGTSEISFTVYQMSTGYRWNNPVTGAEVGTVTLAAGATSDIVSKKIDESTENTNALTMIKVNGETANLSLGVAMAIEDNTVKGPATVTLRLPDGVEVEGYDGNTTTFEKLVLPTKEQIKSTGDMGEIVGWFDTVTNKIVTNNTTVVRNMTIAPYWQNMAGYDFINIGSGKVEGYNNDALPGDIGRHVSDKTGSVKYQGSVSGGSNPVVVSGGEGYSVLGSVLSDSLPVQAGSAVRFDSARSAGEGKYEICMTFANYGTSKLHLSVYHINASSDYKSAGKWYNYEPTRYRVDVQLNPGESVTKLGQYDLGSNGNWLTYIVFEEDVDSFSFGIAESYKAIDEIGESYASGNLLDKTVTIGYDEEANGGIKVAEAYLTQRVGRFIVAPKTEEVTIPDDVIFTGWKIVIHGTEYDLPSSRTDYKDLQVPSSNVTLKAVFSKITNTPVNITLTPTQDFTLSAEYLNKVQNVGGYLVLPEEGDYTNETGLPVVGWLDHATGETLTNKTILTSETLVLEPVFAETVTVTLQLPNGVTATGFKANQAKDAKLVLPTSDMISGASVAPYGWYDVATKSTVTADTVLADDITIAPYWTAAEGYTQIQVGSGANYGYNAQEVPGDLMKYTGGNGLEYYGYNSGGASSKNGDAQLLFGGDYTLLGSVISANKPVQAGSAIRFDSKRTAGVGVYEFSFTVENKGTTDLQLSIYQINASGEYRATTYYGYESRYRTEIRVEAGKTVTALGQYDLGSNGNWMTYIVFEKDVASFSLGIAVGYKSVSEIADGYKDQPALVNPAQISYNPEDNAGIIVSESYLTQRAGKFALAPTAGDITNPDGVGITKWQLVINGTAHDLPNSISSYSALQIPSSGATLKVVLAVPVTVTYQTNNGVSAEGAKTSYYTGNKLVLPEISATTTDGRVHLGWFDTATGAVVTNETQVMGAMTLAPYFEHKGSTALTPLSGATANDKYGPDSISGATNTNFEKITNAVSGDELGIKLNYNGTLAEGNAFRFKTAFSVQAKTYTYTITLTNYGTSELKFTVYQLTGGTTTTGMPSEEVTLAAGASTTVELTIKYTGTNGNALTYFVMGGEVENMSLGVSMSVAEVTATQNGGEN